MSLILQLVCILLILRTSVGSEEQIAAFNDHIDCDIDLLHLPHQHHALIMAAFHSPRVQNEEFQNDAALTHWNVTPHQFYRYFASGGFSGKYNGKAILDAAVDTVNASLPIH